MGTIQGEALAMLMHMWDPAWAEEVSAFVPQVWAARGGEPYPEDQQPDDGVIVRRAAVGLALRARHPDVDPAEVDRLAAAAQALIDGANREAAREYGYPDAAGRAPWDPAREHPLFTPDEHDQALGQARFDLR